MNKEKGILEILLSDPHTELATNKVIELVNDLENRNTFTLLYEFNSENYFETLKFNKEQLRKSKIYWKSSNYIEDICYTTKQYKELYNVQYLTIDGLELILAREKYCLGRGDIVSIIIKQLKELAQELNISIIATAPTSSKTTNDDLNSNPAEVLSFFCKGKTAIEYVDEIILL